MRFIFPFLLCLSVTSGKDITLTRTFEPVALNFRETVLIPQWISLTNGADLKIWKCFDTNGVEVIVPAAADAAEYWKSNNIPVINTSGCLYGKKGLSGFGEYWKVNGANWNRRTVVSKRIVLTSGHDSSTAQLNFTNNDPDQAFLQIGTNGVYQTNFCRQLILMAQYDSGIGNLSIYSTWTDIAQEVEPVRCVATNDIRFFSGSDSLSYNWDCMNMVGQVLRYGSGNFGVGGDSTTMTCVFLNDEILILKPKYGPTDGIQNALVQSNIVWLLTNEIQGAAIGTNGNMPTFVDISAYK